MGATYRKTIRIWEIQTRGGVKFLTFAVRVLLPLKTDLSFKHPAPATKLTPQSQQQIDAKLTPPRSRHQTHATIPETNRPFRVSINKGSTKTYMPINAAPSYPVTKV